MSAYALGAYVNDASRLPSLLNIRPDDLLYFNTNGTVRNPACFLAVNHAHKEYSILYLYLLELLLRSVERLRPLMRCEI